MDGTAPIHRCVSGFFYFIYVLELCLSGALFIIPPAAKAPCFYTFRQYFNFRHLQPLFHQSSWYFTPYAVIQCCALFRAVCIHQLLCLLLTHLPPSWIALPIQPVAEVFFPLAAFYATRGREPQKRPKGELLCS